MTNSAPSALAPSRSLLPSLILAILGFAVDRIHKHVQIEVLGWQGGEITRVTDFFDYVLVWNPGISYGLFATFPPWALGGIIAVALIGLTYWWYRADSQLVRAGLALAIGGALSNALDRWLYGAVADFFHFHWQDYSFYIFNLADTAITIGVGLLILDLVGVGRTRKA